MAAVGLRLHTNSRWTKARRALLCVLVCLTTTGVTCAADVFVSVAADGGVRYATQALDASYTLAYSEAPAPRPWATQAAGARPSAGRARLLDIIQRVAERHGVSPALVEAIVVVESGMDPQAVSAKGAQGAMQLMPSTAARYGLTGRAALRDPERNIDAGVRHLKDLLAQTQGNVALSLAAYNAGAGAIARHYGRIPPYRETMLYVPAVLARTVTGP